MNTIPSNVQIVNHNGELLVSGSGLSIGSLYLFLSMTNRVLDNIAADISAFINERVDVGIIPSRDMLQMDDAPTFRIGIGFNGTSRNISASGGYITQSEVLRVQLFVGGILLKDDIEKSEDRINDLFDMILLWFKARRSVSNTIDESISSISYNGKASITRGNNFIEQYIDFKILRKI